MRKLRAAGAALLLEVVLLTACLPQGGVFGHGDKTPRPEFPGSPMAPAVQIQKREEQKWTQDGRWKPLNSRW